MKIMKKFLAAMAAAALVITAAGCSGEEKAPDGTSATKKVTQVAYSAPEEEDTSEEAVAFLKEYVPLYVKFLEMRQSMPLIFETETVEDEVPLIAGVYIKNKSTIAHSSTDADGYEMRMVYKDGKAYEINEREKRIFYGNYSKDSAKKLVKNSLMKLSLSDVSACEFLTGETEYNGVMYDYEAISAPQQSTSFYYFDKTTGDLCFIVVGDKIYKVITLLNEVKESAFEIPSDYEMIDYNEFSETEAQE